MNFTMFVPQLSELDFVQEKGKQMDDIDSMTEFIDQVILGNKDETPENENTDHSKVFYIVQFNYHCISQQPVVTDAAAGFIPLVTLYPELVNKKISAISLDIAAPPPKTLA